MIGFYVHHVGFGHLHRALAVARHLDEPATVLSSLPDDDRWPGGWVRLPRDDGHEGGHAPADPTARGHLHWAPLHHEGYRRRMSMITEWVVTHRPSAMVVDLSVEVLVLVRLLGVPTVAVTLPGLRDDAAHRRGYELADAIVAPWPARFAGLGPGLAPFGAKLRHVGAVSRYESRTGAQRDGVGPGKATPAGPRGLGLFGGGGRTPLAGLPPAGWEWLSIGPDGWSADPWEAIRSADVVLTHAGLGALADVALARRPAVVIPQDRPHHEQATTASALGRAGLATVVTDPPVCPEQWAALFARARARGGDRWPAWADGAGGRRMAEIVHDVAAASR